MTATIETADRLATLARKMMLTNKQAVALPTTITVAANGQGMTEEEIIGHCFSNPSVCQYIASICRKVTK